MKRMMVLMVTCLVIALAAVAGAAPFYEAYTGYQYVGETQAYNFGFDFWGTNIAADTDSALVLTSDAQGATGVYDSGSLFVDFLAIDFQHETARISLVAWNGVQNPIVNSPLVLDTISFNASLLNPGYQYQYNLTSAQLNTFDNWGWGNVNIKAINDGAFLNYNDFAITRVAMQVESPASVPEPTTLLLLGTGLVGLVGLRLRLNTKRT